MSFLNKKSLFTFLPSLTSEDFSPALDTAWDRVPVESLYAGEETVSLSMDLFTNFHVRKRDTYSLGLETGKLRWAGGLVCPRARYLLHEERSEFPIQTDDQRGLYRLCECAACQEAPWSVYKLSMAEMKVLTVLEEDGVSEWFGLRGLNPYEAILVGREVTAKVVAEQLLFMAHAGLTLSLHGEESLEAAAAREFLLRDWLDRGVDFVDSVLTPLSPLANTSLAYLLLKVNQWAEERGHR